MSPVTKAMVMQIFFISQVVMTAAQSKQPVVHVGNDTDLMVLLTHSVTKELNISMQTTTKPDTVYLTSDIQGALSPYVKSLSLWHISSPALTQCQYPRSRTIHLGRFVH